VSTGRVGPSKPDRQKERGWPGAIVGALGRLGHAGISDVRQGKRFELEVDDSVDDSALAEIAESLLANTVIEEWTVSREPQ
jgi:phosphoribosylformylglycinamidine (FGAM) synthase PurS component